jgi:hypothetical protein
MGEHDRRILRSIRQVVSQVDCLLFVTTLNEKRLRVDEEWAVRHITEFFEVDIWNRAIIVLTHADEVSPERYLKRLTTREIDLRELVARHTSRRIALTIPVVAVANEEEEPHGPLNRPDGQAWVGELYTRVFQRISDRKAVPFYLATRDRIVAKTLRATRSTRTRTPKIVLNEAEELEVSDRVMDLPVLRELEAAARWVWDKLTSIWHR